MGGEVFGPALDGVPPSGACVPTGKAALTPAGVSVDAATRRAGGHG